ncbi:MAG: outer membrane protein [Patiriisocius sp.]|jgi:outer membrane scaffolding protein for murein synthesis (MipA/OmpV family)
MLYSPITKLSLVAIVFIAFSSLAYSADIAHTLRANTQDNNDPDNFIEIGLGASLGVGSSLTDEEAKGIGLFINLRSSYNWNGLFIDLGSETGEPLVIGYNAYNSDNWSFDVVLGTTAGGVSEDTNDRFIGITKRQSSTMVGARLTGYFGKNILQVSLKHDVRGISDGTVATALLGRNWQYRNWNFHGLIGLNISDLKFNDYYLGVSKEESALTGIETYDGKASIHFSSSMGVTYPINENWIYRVDISLGSNFGQNDSPLFEKRRKFYTGINTSINYVF